MCFDSSPVVAHFLWSLKTKLIRSQMLEENMTRFEGLFGHILCL